jgi:single-strand DNA-binding protein
MLNITAHGNLGKDPELKEFSGGQVAKFTLAARTGKDETTWINCAVWGKPAQVAMQYLHKGDKITVAGSGKVAVFQTKDGTEGKSLELNVSEFTLPAREKAQSDADF